MPKRKTLSEICRETKAERRKVRSWVDKIADEEIRKDLLQLKEDWNAGKLELNIIQIYRIIKATYPQISICAETTFRGWIKHER